MDLLNIGALQRDADTSLFEQHWFYDDPSDLKKAQDIIERCRVEKYPIVWYPSVGMDWPTVYLSNWRLAPLQLASPGHSVSSYGSLVDFFLSGEDSEDLSPWPHKTYAQDREKPPVAVTHYSETLVLMRGAGVVHQRPDLALKPMIADHQAYHDDHEERPFIINCPFSAQKVNHAYLVTLRRAVLQSKVARERGVLFRFFPYLAGKLARETFKQSIEAVLMGPQSKPKSKAKAKAKGSKKSKGAEADADETEPANAEAEAEAEVVDSGGSGSGSGSRQGQPLVIVEVFGEVVYDQYMDRMREGDLVIEASHYGGCNTVVDALMLGMPMLTWQGQHWYNRIGQSVTQSVFICLGVLFVTDWIVSSAC